MITLRNHDRVGRTNQALKPTALPSIEKRAEIARQWAAKQPQPVGTRREMHRNPIAPQNAKKDQTSIDQILDTVEIEDQDLADVRAFAAKLLA